ncbi:MAG TPA: hypothetical protein VL326_29820 [Kofleriaceae bacterium]|nr:hypothetical protein [Kofleriaceae bacterium]
MDEARRPFTVAEALEHFEAPSDCVAWGKGFASDFYAAWRACPCASWLAHLAVTARMPFAPMLAAVATAHDLRRRVVPLDAELAELRAEGIPVDDPDDAGLQELRDLVAQPLFADEESRNTGYCGGFFEQAYFAAARELDEIEAMLVAKARRTPVQARTELVGLVRSLVKVDDFMRAYQRCLKNGSGGLEIER